MARQARGILDLVDTVVKAVSRGCELDDEQATTLGGDAYAAALEAAARALFAGEGIPLGAVASWLACSSPGRSVDPRPVLRDMLKSGKFRFEPKLDPDCVIILTGERCFDLSIRIRSGDRLFAEDEVQVYFATPEPTQRLANRTRAEAVENLVRERPDDGAAIRFLASLYRRERNATVAEAVIEAKTKPDIPGRAVRRNASAVRKILGLPALSTGPPPNRKNI